MGYYFHFRPNIPAWTFLCLVQLLSSGASRFVLHDLDLGVIPDITKINISQDEYSHMMALYLSARQKSSKDDVPQLITYDLGKHLQQDAELNSIIEFPSIHYKDGVEVESAELKFMVSPIPINDTIVLQVRLNEIFETKRNNFIGERTLYVSHNLTKWCEFDITNSIQWQLNDKINSKFKLKCLNCRGGLKIVQAFVNAMIFKLPKRRRRSVSQSYRRTDCRSSIGSGNTLRCCRHNMTVTFKDLSFPEVSSIIQPKHYEAGYCQGQCPPNYNFATNHSRIQTLVHQMDRKLAKVQHRRVAIPKACCSPAKLEPLEVIRINPYDVTKLIMETWDNMQVIECACS